jgi:hypothetical protein
MSFRQSYGRGVRLHMSRLAALTRTRVDSVAQQPLEVIASWYGRARFVPLAKVEERTRS